MADHPFLVNKDKSSQKLLPLEGKEQYGEAWLQELLRQYPDILPVAEIEPVFYPMVPIGREISTDTGNIDNLYISHRGYLTLVETKLWRNPDARREVVAQVVDYGSSLSKWDYDKLDSVTRQYTRDHEHTEMGLAEWVENKFGEFEEGQDFFRETVAKNLRLGRFLTMIVGDKIQGTVIQTLNYINRYPGLAMNVVLVELQGYRLETGSDWPLLIVPHTIARTEIVERSVVQVTIIEGKSPEVTVTQETAREGKEGRSRSQTLTEESFWELLKENAGQQYDATHKLISQFKDDNGIEIIPREDSLTVKLYLQGEGKLVTLFFVTTSAKLCVWPHNLARFDTELGQAYHQQIADILRTPKSAKQLASPIANVDIERFKATVYEFIEKIRRRDGENS